MENATFPSIEGSISRNFVQNSELMGARNYLIVNVREFRIRPINLQFITSNFTSLKLSFIKFNLKLKWIYKISLLWYLVSNKDQSECKIWHVVSVIQLQNDLNAQNYLDRIKNFMFNVSLKSSFLKIFYQKYLIQIPLNFNYKLYYILIYLCINVKVSRLQLEMLYPVF